MWIFVLALHISKECPKYKCDDDLEGNTCLQIQGDTYHLNPCSFYNEWYCETDLPQGTTQSMCAYRPVIDTVDFYYPGEPCFNTPQCFSDTVCEQAYCKGKDLKAACTSSGQCGTGLACINGACWNQYQIGSVGCKNDYECVNNAACNFGKCVEYMTLDYGDKVEQCSGYENYLCKDVACRAGACVEPFASKEETPVKCEKDADCEGDTGEYLTNSKCECGYNSKGQSYCSLFPGDEEYQDFYVRVKKWIKSKEIFLCNTERRFSNTCMSLLQYRPIYDKYQYYELRAKNFTARQDNDECVRMIYTRDYYEAKYTHDHDDFSENLSYLLALFSFLLVQTFIN